MNAAIILSERIRVLIEEARTLYREAYGLDTGIFGLLETALVIYKGVLRDVIDHKWQKARAVTGRQHEEQGPNCKTDSTDIER